ncbi:MAG TPA: site-specific integrase [Candidatus Acidoferrales bacterium]|nr:site-specific integrase [Candidatus Acidoferrales bacterium]
MSEISPVSCEVCGAIGKDLRKNGIRYNKITPNKQGYFCKKCGHVTRVDYSGPLHPPKGRSLPKQVINEVQQGKLLEFAWIMQKKGRKRRTITGRMSLLRKLVVFGADLSNTDSVETVLATETFTSAAKLNTVKAYIAFTDIFDIPWEPLKVDYEPAEPFIPLESELDQIIAACGKVTAAFLQVLKDTGARCGEAKQIKWADINSAFNTISINHPEKKSRSRTVKVSEKTIAMLNALPRKYGDEVFCNSYDSIRGTFNHVREKLAIFNPRIKQIHLHTFRHWKATIEYAKDKDLLRVQRLLGHKNIQNTIRYSHLQDFEADEWVVRRPATPKEEDELIMSGFQYVRFDERMGVPIYRKRK